MNSIKQTYLILLIIISLFSLALYSTYAMFTTEINTNNIVTIDTSISINTNIDEYQIITIDSNNYKIFELSINNTKEEDLYYGVWYELLSGTNYSIDAYKLETSQSPTVDIIKSKEQKKISIVLINNTNKKSTLKIGIATSQNTSLNLNEGKYLITNEIANDNIRIQNAAEYITSLYQEESTELYYDNKNLLYYGQTPNNYIILNEELWQILGVYNQKLKIVKLESIGNYIYDIENKELENSKINILLNDLYYEGKTGNCYKTKEPTECDFTTIGLNEESRNKISVQTIDNEMISSSTTENIEKIPIMSETSFESKISLLSLKDYQKSLNCKEEVCGTSWLINANTMLLTNNEIDNNMNIISISDKKIKLDNLIDTSIEIRPVILLNEDVSIIKGIGTKENPYVLK